MKQKRELVLKREIPSLILFIDIRGLVIM